MFKKILKYLLADTEEELKSIYQTDVVECHPFYTPPPWTFEEWKKERTS